MGKNVFDYNDYKRYLGAIIEAKPAGGRGYRSQMADAIGCQRAFVSQVLQGDAHFNLEHGDKLNRFLHHGTEEAHFFLLLIQLARAGTESLREYFRKQMHEVLDRRLVLKNRIQAENPIRIEDAIKYYSAWFYGAVRLVVAIPGYRTKEKIAERLRLSIDQVSAVLDFLVSRGLLEQKGDEYALTTLHMHLGNDSALIAKHHTNWRVRALQSFDREGPRDIHYSSGVCISQTDALKIKSMLVNYIEEVQKVVRPSKEETLYSFCLDFFEL